MEKYELTVKQAEEIGHALMPRIKQVIAAELKPTRDEISEIKTQVATLKAHSRLWGAMSGLVTALAAALLTRK